MAQATKHKNKSGRTDIKQESVYDGDDANATLYAEHEVKQEIVVGPVMLQLPDLAYKVGGKSLSESKQKQSHKITRKMNIMEPVKPVPVKREPEWTSDEDTTLLADLKVKKELLEPDLNRVKIDKIEEKRENIADSLKYITVKQEHVDRTSNLKDTQTKDTKASNTRLKKTVNKLEERQSSKIESEKVIRINSRLRIQFEEEPYEIENQIEAKNIMKHECNKCLKEFRSKAILKTHMRSHTGEKPYSCPFCLKDFSDFAVLCRHKRIHTGQKPHTCDACNKSFSEKYLLKNHKRIHTGEKVYFCKDCPKTFTNSSNYRRHERIHMNKYCCDKCSRYFKGKIYLIKHLTDHCKPKLHVCEICQKRFSNKGHLNRHMESHVGAKVVYACGICQLKFTQHTSLKRHVAKKVCIKYNVFRKK